MSSFTKEYRENVDQVKTTKQEIEIKRFGDFTTYRVGLIYVIEYTSTYSSACRARTYKSYGAMWKVWSEIVEKKIDYTNF